ncbi:hypothetical protein Acr_00g0047850 [Actinidia rufa]|uniref:Uncharacterized protein n=1 Tax=Actinidia rufa TaxID=165716 RepID=A0A7J0DLQ4_9ERIC|nr:hypothetical protein Acr_00g0047850 [Actinidia rufa]
MQHLLTTAASMVGIAAAAPGCAGQPQRPSVGSDAGSRCSSCQSLQPTTAASATTSGCWAASKPGGWAVLWSKTKGCNN